MSSTVVKPLQRRFIYPIYPTEQQIQLFNQSFGCCRKVWNTLLDQVQEEIKHYHEAKAKGAINLPPYRFTGYDLCARQ